MCASRKTSWGRAHRTLTCIALAMLAHPLRAFADPVARSALAATWNAPAGCPTQADVLAQIDDLISESSLTPATTPLVARATVTESLGGFKLDMLIDAPGASKSKAIEAERCDALAQAYAVIVAFTLDPSAGTRQSSTPVLAHTAPAPVPGENAASSDAERRPSSFALAISPIVAGGVGLLPAPAFALGGRVAVGAVPRWEISGAYWPERRAAVSGVLASSFAGAGAAVSLASAGFSACLPFRAVAIEACAGADVGQMRAAAVGVSTISNGSSWWVAPTVALVARLPVASAVALGVRLSLGVPLFRPRFVLENLGPNGPVEVYRPAPAFALLAIEPELRFFSTDGDHGGHFPK
jgi:hypothetical protein